MSNTPIALDTLFVDADSRGVKITKHTMPFSPVHYRCGDPAQFVVGVRAGFADSHGILEGGRIRWRRVK